MIEQYLQVAIEFIKEIWFQLNTMFGLEDTQAFKFLKPYLLQVQNNRTYMVIAIAVLILVPFSIYKVISISQRREKKFNDLMDEMEDEEDQEEEIDINDPRRLRRSYQDNREEAVAKEDIDKDEKIEDQTIPEKEDAASPPFMQVLEEMDEEEREDELHVDTQKFMGTEDGEFELVEPETNENVNEFDNKSDLANYEDVIENNNPHDENPNKDFAPENKPTNEADDLINRLKYFQENLDTRLKEAGNQDPGVEATENDLEKNPEFIEQENFTPKTPKVSPLDKQKYMEVLESFIFLKNQNKH
jgi:hypothetical protein